jgi:hypothetical protein
VGGCKARRETCTPCPHVAVVQCQSSCMQMCPSSVERGVGRLASMSHYQISQNTSSFCCVVGAVCDRVCGQGVALWLGA